MQVLSICYNTTQLHIELGIQAPQMYLFTIFHQGFITIGKPLIKVAMGVLDALYIVYFFILINATIRAMCGNIIKYLCI